MSTKATHTKHRAQSCYAPGTSRRRHSAITLLAQVADIERGQRIRARHEELHLTEPAVVELMEELAWKLPRSDALHPETAAEKKGKNRPIPPLTLRGFQSYKAGGGIAWGKAKLLAQVLQMDVREMMSGESDKTETPDLSRPATAENALAEVLAAITAQLGEQTEVLQEAKGVLVDVKGVLKEVKGLLGKDTETADRIESLTETLGGAAEQLDAHVRQLVEPPKTEVEQAPESAPPRKRAAKRKTAPKRIPRAST